MTARFGRTLLVSVIVGQSIWLSGAAAPAPPAEPEMRYTIGSWIPDTLGNQRAVVHATVSGEVLRVHIPWRRRDLNPDQKNLIVIDASTETVVKNVARVSITREAGDIAFQPVTVPGDYYVYYLPIAGNVKTSYPKVTYPTPAKTADDAWLSRNGLNTPALAQRKWPSLPQAQVVEFQAVDELNSMYPMEVIATAAETRAVMAANAASTLLFPEDRANSIRMTDDLPQRWILKGANKPFNGTAQRGEFYAFQIGVFAARTAITDVSVQFSGLKSTAGQVLVPSTGLKSFNQGGVDSAGQKFTRPLPVATGKVQAMWFGVQVPESATPGIYAGTVTITPKGQGPTPIRVTLTVSSTVINAAGDDNPSLMSRLRWLDSTLAEDDEIVKPYTPMSVEGNTVSVLGRRVTIGTNGLPDNIQSQFSIEMTSVSGGRREILAAPMSLTVESKNPALARWTPTQTSFTKTAPGAVAWQTSNTAGPVTMATQAQMEFDGNIEYVVKLTSRQAVAIDDVRLDIPITRDVAKYMLGFGQKGGLRPASLDWKWDVKNNQDGAWLGDVNAGLQFSLKDEKYVRPLNTNFYTLKPLVMPASWSNGGKGGCRLVEQGDAFLARCYSGARTLKPGDAPVYFNFRLLVTPFKPIDTKTQFSTRYFHAYKLVDEVIANGGNTINIHHANEINPFINYPFLRPAEMKKYVDEAHAKGLKVKIYYTVRELTNHAPELYALLSLGHEVLAPGPGGGYSFLQEHAGTDYIAGWFVPALKDVAIVTSGVSRWHNFYVEGLAWLVKNVAIDGLYIDDVAFDRFTMKRVRKVLERGRPQALIDLHSANQFNVRDGFANSANLYMEHFPYLDRLWFGEYFDYNSQPDFWMTEVAGIPFGLMSEMLQDGGNAWRGMVFGMTARMPRVEMRPMWKAWDDFGIADSRMIGYWVPSSPVKTNNPNVLATVYQREGKTMVALASWAKEAVDVKLDIDWRALGLDPATARITAPAIQDFQSAMIVAAGDLITVAPGKGWLLVIGR